MIPVFILSIRSFRFLVRCFRRSVVVQCFWHPLQATRRGPHRQTGPYRLTASRFKTVRLISIVSSKEGVRQHLEPAELDAFDGEDGWTAWHPSEEGVTKPAVCRVRASNRAAWPGAPWSLAD
jgi:hypothetical protein